MAVSPLLSAGVDTGGTTTKDNVEAGSGQQQNGTGMFWRILIALMKPCVLLALFDLIKRIAESTGLQIDVIDPVSRAISHMTGVPSTYSAMLVIGVAALSLLRVLTAVCRVAVSTIPH